MSPQPPSEPAYPAYPPGHGIHAAQANALEQRRQRRTLVSAHRSHPYQRSSSSQGGSSGVPFEAAVFLASPTQQAQPLDDDTDDALMADGRDLAASPVAGDDDELRGAPVHFAPNTIATSNTSATTLSSTSTHKHPTTHPVTLPAVRHLMASVHRQDSDAWSEPPRLVPGPDAPPPPHSLQNDPNKVQDAKDLAAFAAWVTLRLIGRRWSLLMDQKTNQKPASHYAQGLSSSQYQPQLSHHQQPQYSRHVGNSFAAPSPGQPGPPGAGYSVFVNQIHPSAYTVGSISSASPYHAGSIAPTPVLAYDSQLAAGHPHSSSGGPLLNRYRPPLMPRLTSQLGGYRDDVSVDSAASLSRIYPSHHYTSYYQSSTSGSNYIPSSVVVPPPPPSREETGLANQVSSFGLGGATTNFHSPQSSPLIKGAIQHASSPQPSPLIPPPNHYTPQQQQQQQQQQLPGLSSSLHHQHSDTPTLPPITQLLHPRQQPS
ncbi:hypothetical protein HDU98_003552, partial [Podochytrium sp. JEL0797]